MNSKRSFLKKMILKWRILPLNPMFFLEKMSESYVNSAGMPFCHSNLIICAEIKMIVSNTDKSAAEMISIARMRDRDEKAFRRIKYHFGLTKTDAHSLVTYEGKMLVAFVSLIICEAYRWYVKEQLHAITSTTTATSLGELRKYKILLTQDRYHWIPAYAATKKQKALLKALGCTAAAMEFAARNVSLRV